MLKRVNEPKQVHASALRPKVQNVIIQQIYMVPRKPAESKSLPSLLCLTGILALFLWRLTLKIILLQRGDRRRVGFHNGFCCHHHYLVILPGFSHTSRYEPVKKVTMGSTDGRPPRWPRFKPTGFFLILMSREFSCARVAFTRTWDQTVSNVSTRIAKTLLTFTSGNVEW